jgi:hypothetical protein
VGEILVEDGSVPAPALDAALNKQREVKERKSQESKSLRVDAAKLEAPVLRREHTRFLVEERRRMHGHGGRN